MANASLQHWRWRNDDGSEAGATWIGANDTSVNLSTDTVLRARFGVIHSSGPVKADGFQLQYRLNSGSWTDVSGGSSVVRANASAYVSNNASTTQQVSTGGTYIGTKQFDSDNGATANVSILTGYTCDAEFAFKVRSGDTSPGDTIWLRVIDTADRQVMQGSFTDMSGTIATTALSFSLSETIGIGDTAVESPTVRLSETIGVADAGIFASPPSALTMVLSDSIGISDYKRFTAGVSALPWGTKRADLTGWTTRTSVNE